MPSSYRVTRSVEGMDPSAGKAIRAQFQRACAIAHGVGANMSANQLMQLVMEKGLPPLEERERILVARLERVTIPPLAKAAESVPREG